MQANENHISLETAILFRDCGIESSNTYISDSSYRICISGIPSVFINDKNAGFKPLKTYDVKIGDKINVYTWQEILWIHHEKFFLEDDAFYVTQEIMLHLQEKEYKIADEFFRKFCILTNNS